MTALAGVIVPTELSGSRRSATDRAGDMSRMILANDPKIMIVDDESLMVEVVKAYLQDAGYQRFLWANDAVQALAIIGRETPDVILLDVHMPRVNGLELLEAIQDDARLAGIPVIVVTAETDDEVKLQALELGAIDFIHKPIHSGELLARLRNTLMAKAYQTHLLRYSESLEMAVRERTAALEASRMEVIRCLARAAEFRDDDTGRHVVRVGRYARIIGRELGQDEASLDVLEQAAMLHDIGKIGVPDAILSKPGRLSAEEFDLMQKHSNFGRKIIQRRTDEETAQIKKHTDVGARILDFGRSPILEVAARIALTHHERWDGGGYPLGLAGEDIPLEGRITAVADVFDALSSKRCYKPAFPLEKCFAIMTDGRGAHFDPRVLDAFYAQREAIVDVQIEFADVE